MPDDRMIHRRMLRGDRIAALTDFERGVWLAYELIADDYGVMRLSAVDLQQAVWLEKKPRKTVQRGFEAVVQVGLMHTFQDGNRTMVYQRDWNSWQKVRHPRATVEPCPPVEELRQCCGLTQTLFKFHPRCPSEFFLQDSGNIAAEIQKDSGLTRARAPAMANAKANGSGKGMPESRRPSEGDAERAGEFLERYKALYTKHRKGAHYLGKPVLDFQEAVELVKTWDDDRLDKIATVFLTTDHEFAEKGSRTIAQFRALASWCDGKLREAGL